MKEGKATLDWGEDHAVVTLYHPDGVHSVRPCDSIDDAVRYLKLRTVKTRTVNGDILAAAIALAVLALVALINGGW